MKPIWILAREAFDVWRQEIDQDDFMSAEELYGTGFEAGYKAARVLDAKNTHDVEPSGYRRIVKGYFMVYAGPGVTYCKGSKYHIVHEYSGTCEKCNSTFMLLRKRKQNSNPG